MTTLAELRAAVELLLELPAIGTLLQLNSNTPERAYEAYTLSLCAEAVRRANGQVELIGVQSGINPATVVFRGAPGSMSSTAQNFCYVRCTLGAQQFEIHVDVEYEGQTRATHEIDVSVVDGQHCNSVRATGRSPKTNK